MIKTPLWGKQKKHTTTEKPILFVDNKEQEFLGSTNPNEGPRKMSLLHRLSPRIFCGLWQTAVIFSFLFFFSGGETERAELVMESSAQPKAFAPRASRLCKPNKGNWSCRGGGEKSLCSPGTFKKRARDKGRMRVLYAHFFAPLGGSTSKAKLPSIPER